MLCSLFRSFGSDWIRAFNRAMTSLVVGMVSVLRDRNELFCTRLTDLSEVEDVTSAPLVALSVVKKLVVISGEIKLSKSIAGLTGTLTE